MISGCSGCGGQCSSGNGAGSICCSPDVLCFGENAYRLSWRGSVLGGEVSPTDKFQAQQPSAMFRLVTGMDAARDIFCEWVLRKNEGECFLPVLLFRDDRRHEGIELALELSQLTRDFRLILLRNPRLEATLLDHCHWNRVLGGRLTLCNRPEDIPFLLKRLYRLPLVELPEISLENMDAYHISWAESVRELGQHLAQLFPDVPHPAWLAARCLEGDAPWRRKVGALLRKALASQPAGT